jgi:hypothetical protein
LKDGNNKRNFEVYICFSVESVELCQIVYNIMLYELFIKHDISVVIKTDRIRRAFQWISKCDGARQGEFRITIQI